MGGTFDRCRRHAAALSVAAVIGLLTGVVAAVSATTVASAGPPRRVANPPVVFVHGFLLNLCPQEDVTAPFAGAAAELKAKGYKGTIESVAYYACDSNGPSIQSSGDPNAYFPSGAYLGTGGNTDQTDIRHISYELAWYLYNKYSSHGQTVDIVAHSMGGLIVRWALYQIQAHDPVFPPVLYVQDVVTLSTPHNGIQDGYNNLSWCAGTLQCTQMTVGSSFLAELRSSGMDPQATGGTVWTAEGSSSCDIMTAAQSTDMGDVHKIIFEGTAQPYCYDHTGYLTDTSDAADMPAQFTNPGDPAFTTTSTGAHSLAWMANALRGIYPPSHPSAPQATQSVQDLTTTWTGIQTALAGIHL
jgi:hypothetical protein